MGALQRSVVGNNLTILNTDSIAIFFIVKQSGEPRLSGGYCSRVSKEERTNFITRTNQNPLARRDTTETRCFHKFLKVAAQLAWGRWTEFCFQIGFSIATKSLYWLGGKCWWNLPLYHMRLCLSSLERLQFCNNVIQLHTLAQFICKLNFQKVS